MTKCDRAILRLFVKIIIGMSLYLFPDEILPDGREGPEMAEKFSDFLSVGGE